ncbi:MAG: hypothetical protein PUF10_10495 [Bacteroidales bacterium]|nr:hypothetical protein [Bacteroidales bacterium]
MKNIFTFISIVFVIMALNCNGNLSAQDSYDMEPQSFSLSNEKNNEMSCAKQSSAFQMQLPSKYHQSNKTFSFIAEARLICNMPYDAGVPRKKAIVAPSACNLGYNFSFGTQINDQFFIGGGFGFDWHRMKLNYSQYASTHGGNLEDAYESGLFEYGANAERIYYHVLDFGVLHRKLRTIMDFYADFRWEPDFASSVIPTAGIKTGFGFGGLYGFITVHFVFRPFIGVMYKISDDHKIFLNLE